MKLSSLKILVAFLAAGVLWALVNNPLITLLTHNLDPDNQDLIRGFSDVFFVAVVTMFLYYRIKKQQQKLVRSELEYRRLFELNPNPMWVYDTETFKFVKVNDSAIELYGYTMREFLSMTIKDIRPPNDNDKLVEYVRSMQAGTRRAGTWRHFKKSGELLYVSIASHHMRFENRPCSLVMITNITDSVLNEARIKAQHNALQEIAWANSHEVRHSLCSVISLVDLLSESKDETEQQECLKLLKQCTAELDNVLKKMGRKVDELEKV